VRDWLLVILAVLVGLAVAAVPLLPLVLGGWE